MGDGRTGPTACAPKAEQDQLLELTGDRWAHGQPIAPAARAHSSAIAAPGSSDAGNRDGAGAEGGAPSWIMSAVSRTIHGRPATPTANITNMRAQQQPRQKAPWRKPERPRAAALVVAPDEGGGVAALVETGVLELAELDGAGEREH